MQPSGRRDVRDRRAAWRPVILICDEAHALKDRKSSRTRAVLEAGKGLAHHASHVWFVTGTPTPNNSSEYYPFAKLSGAFKGDFNAFADRFCTTIPVWRNGYPIDRKIIASKNHAELVATMRPHVLAREAVESERPPLEIDTFACEGVRPDLSGIDPAELAVIEDAIASGDLEAIKDFAPDTVATIRRLVGLAKAESVADLAADELAADAEIKSLIFCEHTATIDIIAARLAPFGAGIVDGRTPNKDRPGLFASFEPGGTGALRVLVCHRRSASEGLTLTRATRVLLAEPSWTPDDNKQAIARAWRRGQRRPVRATFCYLPRTIDEGVARTLKRKTQDVALLQIS